MKGLSGVKGLMSIDVGTTLDQELRDIAADTPAFELAAPLAAPSPGRAAAAWPAAKRIADVLLAVVLLAAILPLVLIIAIAIRLDTPGPLFFRQERLGRHRRKFTVLKFRTMHDGVSPEAHRLYIAKLAGTDGEAGEGLKKLTADPRVTRVGAFLRRTSLDELPQLINVVRGEMSIVGPRPALAYELEHYEPAALRALRRPPGPHRPVAGVRAQRHRLPRDARARRAVRRDDQRAPGCDDPRSHAPRAPARQCGLTPAARIARQRGVAIVGLGYWGPNLLRNAWATDGMRVVAACDQDPAKLAPVAHRYPTVRTTRSYDDVLAAGDVDAVIIATPVRTHYDARPRGPARRQARLRREAAGADERRVPRAHAPRRRALARPHAGPHVPLLAPGAEGQGAARRAASSASCTSGPSAA